MISVNEAGFGDVKASRNHDDEVLRLLLGGKGSVQSQDVISAVGS